MARYSQRPENALKRANEFIDVGKPSRALETLYEVFKNKKWAYTWSESLLEPIMFKYLDLCVELKKSVIAKEGLFQYRNMFQSVNVGSLENVIRGYLRMAEEKTESAREQSQQAVIDIDDLDNVATPESILLRAVSGEDAQDRSDRTILTPWVKFLWESYCQCLELLRTNAHCETLYHDIVRMAFNFCLKYNRKTEFRKLSDKLRKHLDDINKPATQVSSVSLSKAETQQYNLETRLVQLDSAIQMELWQEAYKAIEDIHALMNISKKPPVSKTMANYYQKLAMVFWKAGYYLFHAAALFKLFQLSKDMKKNITHDELQRMACCVLLATLSIPLPSAHPEFDRFIETDKSPLEKTQRLATLLTLQQPPTRASLIRDLVRMNVVQRASAELQELYQALEVDFNPLTLCKRVHAVTSQLQGDEQYIPPLQDVTLVKLIRQVSQVYQTVKFDRLLELALFTDAFHLERLLVDCVRHNDMQIRIDHGAGSVNFGMDLSETPRENAQDGPILQSMPSDQLRTQLINMANVLNDALNFINPNFNRAAKDKIRIQLVHHYKESMVNEHKKILERHQLIEDRKEHLERINSARVKEEKRRAEELAHQQAQIEERRLQQEREERERRRQENEIQQIKDRNFKEKMQQISQTAHGQKMLRKLDEEEIKSMDAEQIAMKEAEELQKERKEMLQKLKSQEKKVDYYERAKRLEEIPLLKQSFAQRQVEEKKLWEEQEAQRIAELVVERDRAVETRKRLARMTDDCRDFLTKLEDARNSVYQEKLKDYLEKLNGERSKRLSARKEQRIAERKEQWEKEREEEKRRKEEEEERLRVEEETRKKEEEERAKKEAREAENKKKADELKRISEVQRKREEEVQRKQAEKEKQLAGSQRGVWRSKTAQEREEKGKVGDRPERTEEAPTGSWRTPVERSNDVEDRDRERSAFGTRRDDDRSFGRRMDDRSFGRRERDEDARFGVRRPVDRDREEPRRRLSPSRPSERRAEGDRFGPRGFGERDRPRESGGSAGGSWRRPVEAEPEKEPPRRPPPPPPAEERKEWRKEPAKPAPPPERTAPPPPAKDEGGEDDDDWKTVGRR